MVTLGKEDVTVAELVRIFWYFKKTIILTVGLVTTAAIIYSLVVTPVFRSEALLKPTEQMSSGNASLGALAQRFGALATIAGANISPDVNEAIAIIESREFTERLLLNDNLIRYIYQDQWDAELADWREGEESMLASMRQWLSDLLASNAQGSASAQPGGYTGPSLEIAVRRFNAIRRVSLDRRTNFVKISVDWEDPVVARDWVQLIVDRVNESMRERTLREVNLTLDFLREQIDNEQNSALRSSMSMLYQQQLEKAMLATSRTDYSLQYLDRPSVPEMRRSPRRKLIVVGTFLISGMLVCASVLLYVAFLGTNRRNVRSPGD